MMGSQCQPTPAMLRMIKNLLSAPGAPKVYGAFVKGRVLLCYIENDEVICKPEGKAVVVKTRVNLQHAKLQPNCIKTHVATGIVEKVDDTYLKILFGMNARLETDCDRREAKKNEMKNTENLSYSDQIYTAPCGNQEGMPSMIIKPCPRLEPNLAVEKCTFLTVIFLTLVDCSWSFFMLLTHNILSSFKVWKPP